jgi:hypothetical protein
LITAIEALHAQAAETDPASPEGSKTRAAIDTLEMIRDQGSVEHFDPNCGGRLTSLIDIIIFGAAVSPI